MMDALRKHMKKVMWVIAFMFIGGIFFWYGKIGGITDAVAQVNGFKISAKDYHKRVTQQLRRDREQMETELSDDQILQIRRQILSSMITQEVLYQEAKRLGIIVTTEEIISTIHSLPQFQQDKEFNFQLYIQTLRYSMNSTPDDFEILIKKNIANRKLERLILTSAKATIPELKITYLNSNGNLNDFDDSKEELKNTLLQNKRTALYKSWMTSLQQKTKINVNTDLAGLTNKSNPSANKE